MWSFIKVMRAANKSLLFTYVWGSHWFYAWVNVFKKKKKMCGLMPGLLADWLMVRQSCLMAAFWANPGALDPIPEPCCRDHLVWQEKNSVNFKALYMWSVFKHQINIMLLKNCYVLIEGFWYTLHSLHLCCSEKDTPTVSSSLSCWHLWL